MKQIITVSLLLSVFCLAQAQEKFVVTGKFSGAPDGKLVTLSVLDGDHFSAIDSVLLKEGQFILKGTVEGAVRAYLTLRPAKGDSISPKGWPVRDMQEFYLEKGNVEVTGTDKMATAGIKAGLTQREQVLLASKTRGLQDKMVSLMDQGRKAIAAKDDSARKVLSVTIKATYDELTRVKDSFIYSHPDSYISVGLVNEKTTIIELDKFEPFYNALSKRVLDSKPGRALTAKLTIAKNTTPGHAMDFTQNDAEGKPFSLASLKGKYVLVDFWASWCHPCRAENPNVVKAYNKLKDKNFEIVSVSLDEYKAAWVNAIEKDSLPWIQVSDLKGWKNELALKYGISAVPQNFLVDPNGIIIAKNLRGEDLYDKLSGIMASAKK